MWVEIDGPKKIWTKDDERFEILFENQLKKVEIILMEIQ
jgi:hypothetical protein